MHWAGRKAEIVSIAFLVIFASMYGALYHLNQNAVAGTEVSGHITTDTNWTVSESPYWIVGDTFVDHGATLTIEAGVSVLFNGSFSFNVSGRLRTWGNQMGMVVFSLSKPPTPPGDYWKGIVIEREGSLHLNYTYVSYALCGISVYSYYQDNVIMNSQIIHNVDCGISMKDYSHIYILSSRIAYNNVGVDLGYSMGSLIDDTQIFNNNKGIAGGYSHARIQNSVIYNNANFGVFYESMWGGSTASYSWYWNNTVSGNGLQDPNGAGMHLNITMGDTIGCNVISNNGLGLILQQAYNPNIHHNDFVSNKFNAMDDQANYFDDGSTGNYWDNYTGTDSDGDGIGDIPYYVDHDSVDRYPSVYPFGGCGDVNEPPVANANGPYSGKKGLVIEFDGTGSYDTDGSIVEYEWDFGDGSGKAYGEEVNHTYSAAGLYDVNLKVTDNDGATDNDTTFAEIIDGYPDPPLLIDAVLTGAMLEDVELSWSLSGDDGAGDNDVVNYKIYRGTTYDPDCAGYGLVATLPSGSGNWIDAMGGHGDPNTYFYCVAAVDDAAQESLASQQASKFAKHLSPGMVLMSMPLEVSDDYVPTVFQTVSFQRIIHYDANAGKRHNWRTFDTRKPYADLLTIDRTMAVWVEVLAESYFTIAGLVPQETTIHLVVGWNFVGYPSFMDRTILDTLSVHYQRVESYDPTNTPWFLMLLGDSDLMTAGEGYWIHVSEDYDWGLTN